MNTHKHTSHFIITPLLIVQVYA